MNLHKLPAIEVQGLTKRYGNLLAVDHIDFEVQDGEIFGFLGPNGAGKTTTVMMLTTFLEPTDGVIRIRGHDVSRGSLEARAHIGVVPEESNVYTEHTAEDNLLFVGKIYRMQRKERRRRATELLEMFGLSDKARIKAQEFSRGMRRRLTVAMALMHDPKILFLDEPISGLDVQSTRYIKTLVRDLNESGVTVFLTTHQIEVASELCHRVAIINQGRIATIGTPNDLKASIESVQTVEVTFGNSEGNNIPPLAGLPSVNHEVKSGNSRRLYTDSPEHVIPALVNFSSEHGLRIVSLNTLGPSLEDVFLKITGQEVGIAASPSNGDGKHRRKGMKAGMGEKGR